MNIDQLWAIGGISILFTIIFIVIHVAIMKITGNGMTHPEIFGGAFLTGVVGCVAVKALNLDKQLCAAV